jgi:glycerate-2-kinase
MDRSPSFPFAVDEKAPKGDPSEALPRKAFRGAITVADAYQATRSAVRVEGDVLRVGNRFVPVARYREIAFVAVGNASVSQALAVVHALGKRLTQGLLVNPEAAPPEIPFRTLEVPRGPPGAPAAVEAGRLVLELAAGLGPNDLLIPLLSAGALSTLAIPEPGRGPPDPARFLGALRAAGATAREVALATAVSYGGAVDGGLAEVVRGSEVQPIVVDRGDGGGLVGGSPTRRLTPAERTEAAGALARAAAASPGTVDPAPAGLRVERPPLPATVGRPVVVAAPDDALRGAAEAVGEKRYLPRLARRAFAGDPETVAAAFTDRLDEILREEAGALRAPDREGLVAFGTATFEVPEGLDERPAIRRFLAEARPRLRHRGAVVGAFATSGGEAPNDPAGGFVEAGPASAGEVLPVHGVPMRFGITDVGGLLIAVVPTVRS